MNDIGAVQTAMAFSAVAWMAALVYFAPNVWRLLTGRGHAVDLRSGITVIALVIASAVYARIRKRPA